MRSLLFVPADSERKLARAAAAGADALILDLEDSVTAARKEQARSLAARYLREHGAACDLWVRVNDLRSAELPRDLAAMAPAHPAVIVLPKIESATDIEDCARQLDAIEAAQGLAPGGIGLLALVTETPSAVLRMAQLLDLRCARLRALTWGAEDLSSALGAADPRTPGGGFTFTYEYARTQCLLAAHALAVEAIEGIYPDYRDAAGLERSCRDSRRDGFTGRLAIHPDQVAIINAAYAPTAAERAWEQRVVEAFGTGAGTVAIDGRMYDLPHLKAAQRLLRGARAPESSA